ncbi:MAG: hypothetical protein J7D60_10055 [Prosthecochloris sp.]|jgi:uncharacterized protein|nr:hypothetical protein [Prosthecochloris sp.]
MSRKDWADWDGLQEEVLARYACTQNLVLHGPEHWRRVEVIGLSMARECGADPTVVRLFAWLHDACRLNDDTDDGHGRRSAELVRALRSEYFSIGERSFRQLCEACHYHADGLTTTDPTIGVCWDADRLDLPRVGIMPETHLMSTAAGRDLAAGLRSGPGSFFWSDS